MIWLLAGVLAGTLFTAYLNCYDIGKLQRRVRELERWAGQRLKGTEEE